MSVERRRQMIERGTCQPVDRGAAPAGVGQPVAEFCVAALKAAVARFGGPGIFNTDQESQFSRDDFTDMPGGAEVKTRRTDAVIDRGHMSMRDCPLARPAIMPLSAPMFTSQPIPLFRRAAIVTLSRW